MASLSPIQICQVANCLHMQDTSFESAQWDQWVVPSHWSSLCFVLLQDHWFCSMFKTLPLIIVGVSESGAPYYPFVGKWVGGFNLSQQGNARQFGSSSHFKGLNPPTSGQYWYTHCIPMMSLYAILYSWLYQVLSYIHNFHLWLDSNPCHAGPGITVQVLKERPAALARGGPMVLGI